MHQDLGFKPSPLLEKVLQEKLPKLAPEALQAVIKRARNLTRLTQPSGCAQNLKAEFQDPEKALEYSKRKNQLFETYLKTEINKLHFKESLSMRPEPSVFSKSCQPSPTKLSVKPSKSLEISPSLRNPRKAKSFCSSLRNKPRNSLESFIEVALNKEQLVLPPLVKSVPIHLDPQFAFPKKDSAQEAEKIEKVKSLRMKSLNFVDLRCRNFRPECKSDAYEIALMQDLRRKQDEKFGVYVEDLADCLKLANDQASLEASLINKSHNRRLNEEFLSELAVLKEGLLDVTKDAIDYGGKKIWRYKNTLFLAKTDRVINSVPTTRK